MEKRNKQKQVESDPKQLFASLVFGLVSPLVNGRLFRNQLLKYRKIGLLLFAFCLVYIYHGFEMEKLLSERSKLEKEIESLRFEANTVAADLMFSKKKSEVMRRITERGSTLIIGNEPPVKIYED